MHPVPAWTPNLTEPLRDDEIHVWRLDYRSSGGRAPLRSLLGAYLGVEASAIELVEGEHGRPRLAPDHRSTIDFNWSHSGEQALIAVGHGLSLGIDVERQRERPRAGEIAERYFSADEAALLCVLAEPQRSATFLRLWTAKEAVLKALGRGLAFGLHRVDIDVRDGRLRLRRLEGEQVSAWQLQALPTDATLVAALAWRGGARHVRTFTWDAGTS